MLQLHLGAEPFPGTLPIGEPLENWDTTGLEDTFSFAYILDTLAGRVSHFPFCGFTEGLLKDWICLEA